MRKTLKILGWCLGILMILSGLAFWRNYFFYPKVWGSHITVDGRMCSNCSVYVHRSRVGGVLVRRDRRTPELYSVGFPNHNSDVPGGAVWKCVDGAFSFAPGLAFHSLNQWCAPRGFPSAQKQVQVKSRLIEFTADDGRRLSAAW